MPNPHRPAHPARRVPLLPGLLLIAIVAAVTVGAWLQFGERQALDTVYTAGRTDRDRIDINATIQRVDAAGRGEAHGRPGDPPPPPPPAPRGAPP
ncbi:hypothetical protein ACFVZQ_25070, partial [Streptomyces sp. NPDC059538]